MMKAAFKLYAGWCTWCMTQAIAKEFAKGWRNENAARAKAQAEHEALLARIRAA